MDYPRTGEAMGLIFFLIAGAIFYFLYKYVLSNPYYRWFNSCVGQRINKFRTYAPPLFGLAEPVPKSGSGQFLCYFPAVFVVVV